MGRARSAWRSSARSRARLASRRPTSDAPISSTILRERSGFPPLRGCVGAPLPCSTIDATSTLSPPPRQDVTGERLFMALTLRSSLVPLTLALVLLFAFGCEEEKKEATP